MINIWQKIKDFGNWIKKQWLKIVGGIAIAATITTPVVMDLTRNEVSLEKVQQKYEQAVEIKAKYQINNASLIRTDIKNPELDKYKGEPKDEIKITLGDKDKTEFVPNIELKRWNEVSFKIKPNLDGVATKDKNLTLNANKIKFDTPKISFEMYDYAEGEGGYKFIWYLNEKPATNKVEFQIESSGLDFFYQPELTPEEIAEGAFRPENVVGSYAVYHSTKGGMNDINGKEYKVGKAFHIYRPHIIDAEGKETWGILHIENGVYSEEIPQEFLDTAVYPIRSNATFGYTSIGGTAFVESFNNRVWLSLVNSTITDAGGTVQSVSFYGSGMINDIVYGGVYKNNSGTYNFLSPSGNLTIPDNTASWFTITISGGATVSNGDVVYATAHIKPDSSVYRDTGTGTNTQTKSGITMGIFDDPLSGLSNTTNRYSFYATYTPSGGGAVEEPIYPPVIIFE